MALHKRFAIASILGTGKILHTTSRWALCGTTPSKVIGGSIPNLLELAGLADDGH
jgi:hypothetical protein